MKEIRLMASLLLLTIFVSLASCNKGEALKYSCDERAHEYAVMNLEANQEITRDDLVKLERSFQFAVFRSLTPANKKRIFNEKIDLLLTTVNLTTAEKEHLELLKNYNDLSMYESDGAEIPFLVQWEATARTVLGWSDNVIQGMVGTWATPQELITMAGQAINLQVAGKGDCTCLYDMGCAGFGDCKSGSCKTSSGGCGIIGTANCKGNCPEDRIGPSGGGIAQ